MSEPAKQAGAAGDMRTLMPETARWIDARRLEYGKEHVNDCVRRAIKGEAGLFYAMEAGRTLGTPFAANTDAARWQSHAVFTGAGFAAFIAPPVKVEVQHGAG